MIQFVVMGQFLCQPFQFGRSRLLVQHIYGGLIGGHAGISIFTVFLVL